MAHFKSWLRTLAITALLIFAPLSQCAHIIFDLGDVAFTTKKFKAMKKIGLWNLMRYGGNPRNLFFKYMDSVVPRAENTVGYDEEGNPLPQLMIDWMLGTQTGAEIANTLRIALDKDTTLTNSQYKVLYSLTYIFDDIPSFIKTKKLVKKTLRFVKECKENGHKVYILSNWDAVSMKAMREKYPDFFNLFDGAIVSGEVHLMKPDPAIFQLLFAQFNIKPEDAIFIDDQKENIKAAQDLGIKAILCTSRKSWFKTKPDIAKVRKEVNDWLDRK